MASASAPVAMAAMMRRSAPLVPRLLRLWHRDRACLGGRRCRRWCLMGCSRLSSGCRLCRSRYPRSHRGCWLGMYKRRIRSRLHCKPVRRRCLIPHHVGKQRGGGRGWPHNGGGRGHHVWIKVSERDPRPAVSTTLPQTLLSSSAPSLACCLAVAARLCPPLLRLARLTRRLGVYLGHCGSHALRHRPGNAIGLHPSLVGCINARMQNGVHIQRQNDV